MCLSNLPVSHIFIPVIPFASSCQTEVNSSHFILQKQAFSCMFKIQFEPLPVQQSHLGCEQLLEQLLLLPCRILHSLVLTTKPSRVLILLSWWLTAAANMADRKLNYCTLEAAQSFERRWGIGYILLGRAESSEPSPSQKELRAIPIPAHPCLQPERPDLIPRAGTGGSSSPAHQEQPEGKGGLC